MTPELAAKVLDNSIYVNEQCRDAARMGADALRRLPELEARVKELEEQWEAMRDALVHSRESFTDYADYVNVLEMVDSYGPKLEDR